jgi:hypothetical protein
MEGTGIEYPTIEIAGKRYTVKFSRGALYRLDKAGFDLRELGPSIQRWFPNGGRDGNVRLSVLFDVLHSAIAEQLPTGMNAMELCELALPMDSPGEETQKRVVEIATAIIQALIKMAPPAQTRLRETAAPLMERTQ